MFAYLLKLLLAAPISYGLVFAGWPPERFTGDAQAQVWFVSQGGLEAACGKPPAPLLVRGCVKRDVFGRSYMFVPRPEDVSDEEFRRIVAHEIGHTLGWDRTHPE